MDCPADNELEALLRSAVAQKREAVLSAHMEECARCRERLESLAGGSGWIEAGRTTVPAEDSPALEQAMQALETSVPAMPGPEEVLEFLDPSDTPNSLGRLGAYEVMERIASGGMGIVLRAHDPSLNRAVAVKVLAPALARHALARARFIREARAAAAVVHDNVVSIHAVEELSGLPCIIMQLVKGRSLSDRLRASGPMRLEEILRIGAQAAHGLAAAHAQGLVHRDVKPGNILLENGVERVKLTDFGLARAVDDTELTRAGQMAGTPEYMSPEQIRGEAVDQRTDLFSLGCVLYAMAAGKSPFHGGNTMAVLRRVCEDEPAPLAEYPRWFREIVTRLMKKNPPDRFQTAEEVATLLELRLQQYQRGEAVRKRGWPRWLPWAAVFAAAALCVFAVRHWRPVPLVTPQPPAPSTAAGPAVFTLLSADGARAAFSTLQEAVNAAPSGATIEITASGRFDSQPVRVTGKPLRLRAAPGVLPVLWQPDAQAGLLVSDSALVVEGIAFERAPAAAPLDLPRRRNPPTLTNHADASDEPLRRNRDRDSAPQPLIYIKAAAFRATHCRFAVRDPSALAPSDSSAAIKLEQSRGAVLQHCEFLAVHAFGIDSQTGADIEVTDSVFLGRGFLRAGPHPSEPRRIVVGHCTVAAQIFLTPDKNAPAGPPVAFSLRHSVVDVSSILTVPPSLREDMSFKPGWQWSGGDNVYSVHDTYLSSRRAQPDDLKSLAQWRTWWPAEESGSAEAQIGFPGLPLQSGSITDFCAAFLKFTASGAPDAVAGADTALAGPGAAYDIAKAAGKLSVWDTASERLLAPLR